MYYTIHHKGQSDESYDYWAVASDTTPILRQPLQFSSEDAANLRIGQLQIMDKLNTLTEN